MGRRLLPSEFGTGTVPATSVITAAPDTLQIVGTPNTANDSVNKQYVDDQIASNTGASDYQADVDDIVATPASVYPGTGLPAASTGQRYIVEQAVAANDANWGGNNDAFGANDIVEYSGTKWEVKYDSSASGEGALVWNRATNLSGTREEKYWYYDSDSTWKRFRGVDATTAGAGLGEASGVLSVNVDDTGIEIATDTLQLKDSGVATAKIADDAVTAAKINADVAGDGLVPNGTTGALDVNTDGTTIETNADQLRVVAGGIGTSQLADDSVTAAKLNADTAGLGLVANGGTGALDVNVDDVGIEISTDTLQLKDSGVATAKIADDAVTAAKINADVAGAGLVQNGGTGALDVQVAEGIEIVGDTVQLDQSYTFTGSASWTFPTGATLAVADAPTADSDVANKAYVDSVASGLDPKESVRAATTAVLSGTMIADDGTPTSGQRTYDTTNKQIQWFAGDGPTLIDGITIADGDRILVKDETSSSGPGPGEGRIYNGIYERISQDVWQRAADHDGTPSNEVSAGNFTFVEQGTQADTGWVMQGDGVITLQTDNVLWVQFSGAGSILAGDGIDKVGNTLSVDVTDIIDTSAGLTETSNNIQVNLSGTSLEFDGTNGIRISASAAGDGLGGGGASALSVNVDDTTIEINADSLRVKAAGIDSTHIALDAVNDTHLDLGTGANQINADTFGFGSGGYDGQATTVGGALNELLIFTETHAVITADESARYFDLSFTPARAASVRAFIPGGAEQINAAAGASVEDFEMGSVNLGRFYIRNGAGVGGDGPVAGLSELIADGDELVIQYQADA